MNAKSWGELTSLAHLPERVRTALSAAFACEPRGAGRVLFREGESSEMVCFVASGQVALDMNVPGRGAQRVLTLGAGDLVGWSPLVGSDAMTATATALTDCELFVAQAGDLQRLFAHDCESGYAFMQQVAAALARRLVATRLQMLDVFQSDAPMSDRMMAAP